MKWFDGFSQNLQEALNRTNFWIAEKFLVGGFIFLFFAIKGTIDDPKRQISGYLTFAIVLICLITLMTFFKLREEEKIFLEKNKIIIGHVPPIIDIILFVGTIFLPMLAYFVGGEIFLLYFALGGIGYMASSLFSRSTPVRPIYKNQKTGEDKQ